MAMAESTCLLRTFSNDISSLAKEGDSICAKLGESISFGRFMSDSLAWEKWSTFSHNRYVEEAERFSKPGTVAEKKAYFEAHYKKKAAERSASLIQEANDSANRTFDSEAQDATCNNSSIEIKSRADNNVAVVEQRDGDAVNHIVVNYADQNKYKSDIEQSKVDISGVEKLEDGPQRVDTNLSMDISSLFYSSNQFDNVEVNKKIAIRKEERMTDPEIQALSVRRREVDSSLELPCKTGAVKLSYSLTKRKAVVLAKDKINGALGSKKSAGDSFEKKRPTSIIIPSCAGVTSKTTSVSEQNRIKKINPNLAKIPEGALIEASSNPQSEGRRTKRLLAESVSRGVYSNANFSSLSVDCLKSSSTTRINPRLPTIPSPFKFRTEERAAKRKEFFQRLDDIKHQKSQKVQVRKICKKKTDYDTKKLQQKSDSISKLDADISDGLRSPSNETRKVPVELPRPPSNQMRKVLVTPPRSPSSNTNQDESFRKFWKPLNPIATNNSKRVTEKIKQKARRSLVRKITRENASPNIQR